jgi:hypothetical protein
VIIVKKETYVSGKGVAKGSYTFLYAAQMADAIVTAIPSSDKGCPSQEVWCYNWNPSQRNFS